jgi:hypothetical protein
MANIIATIIQVGIDLNLAFKNAINTSLQNLAQKDVDNYNELNGRTEKHISGLAEKHPAQDITYSGSEVGADVKTAIDNVYNRVNTIVAGAGESNTEILDMRHSTAKNKDFEVSGNRLEEIETEAIAHKADYMSVKQYGAVGDGITDDTQAFRDALNAATAKYGKVFVPPTANGYLIAGHEIVIPAGVTLYGATPRFKGYWGYKERGSTLLITANAGAESLESTHNGAAFVLSEGSTIKDLSFYYPNQTLTNPPVAYPFLIRCEGYTDMTLCNLYAHNVYQFIDALPAHARLRLDNLYFDSYKTGIVIDDGLDVDRVTNIHAWTFSTEVYGVTPEQKTAIITYKYNNHTALSIGRSDSIQLSNIFVWGAKYGLLLGDNNKSPYGQATNLSFDGVAIAVYTKIIGGQGFLISNLMYGNGPSAKTAYSFPKLVTLLLGHKLGTLEIVNINSWGGSDNFIEATADYGSMEYEGTIAHTNITNAQVYNNGNPEFVLNNGVGGDITIRNMYSFDSAKKLATTATAGTAITFENPKVPSTTFNGVPQTIKVYEAKKPFVNINSAYSMDIGNAFNINVIGTATIEQLISTHEAGDEITLIFTNNTILAGSTTYNLRLYQQFNATPNDIITLLYTGTVWLEKGRSVNIS